MPIVRLNQLQNEDWSEDNYLFEADTLMLFLPTSTTSSSIFQPKILISSSRIYTARFRSLSCCIVAAVALSASPVRSFVNGSVDTTATRLYNWNTPTNKTTQRMASSSITERGADGTITVSPKNESDQNALVVICHGLGDTAEGFADVAEHLTRTMPHIKFILPTAPTQRVTLNMGMSMPSWYDIVGLDERSNEQCTGIQQSRERLESILRTEHENTQLPYSRMVLAGFSQGGALSLFTGLQLSEPLAAIVVMSGYVPAASQLQIQTESVKQVPILHCHGTNDAIVPYKMAEKSIQLLKAKGVTNIQFESFPIQHTVSPEELGCIAQFLRQHLPNDPSCAVKLADPAAMSVKELKAAIRKAGLSHRTTGFMEKQEYVRLLQDHRSGKL